MSNPVNATSTNPFVAQMALTYAVEQMRRTCPDINLSPAVGCLHRWAEGAEMPDALDFLAQMRPDTSPIVEVSVDYDCDGIGYSFRMFPRFRWATSGDNWVPTSEACHTSLDMLRRDMPHMLRERWTDCQDGTFYQSRFFADSRYSDEYETTGDLNEAHWIESMEADLPA